MAVRRKPLSPRVVASLKAKASGSRPRIGMAQWSMARVNSFLRGSRKHDTDLRRRRKK